MTPRDRLKALFSPTRRWIGADAETVRSGGWLGPVEVVVPRSASQYRLFRFPRLSAEQRAAALRIGAGRAAPTGSAPWTARWQGEVAHVWLVDPAALANTDPAATLVSESSLRAPPARPDAARLLAMREGFEGQVWREGALVASHWWPEAPDAAAWARFLRSASHAVDGSPAPIPEHVPLLATPWGRADRGLPWSAQQLERGFWRALVVLLGLVIGWQASATAAWAVAGVLQESELERLRSESMPLIEAREQAEAARDRMAGYVALAGTPVDHALIADVRRALPDEARLVSWYRDAGRLRFEVQSASADPRVFVQAFSGHPLLAGVVANPGDAGRMQLEVDLDAGGASAGGPP